MLALDGIQVVPDWSAAVKGLWDAVRLEGLPLHVWFGQRLCQPSETGRRPASAAALPALLVESLPTELSGQIKVLVIDVSRPDTAASRDR